MNLQGNYQAYKVITDHTETFVLYFFFFLLNIIQIWTHLLPLKKGVDNSE